VPPEDRRQGGLTGGGRTYSGVCGSGQAAWEPVLPAKITISRWRVRRYRGLQRFLKLPSDRDDAGRFPPETRNGRSQEARRAQVSAAARLGYPRGRLCGASMHGPRYVVVRGEDYSYRCKRAGGQGAACIFARRKDRTKLQSGLAARKILWRQVYQVKFSVRVLV